MKFTNIGKKIRIEDVDSMERRLGLPIPNQMKDFLLEVNGGVPVKRKFRDLVVSSFLALNEIEDSSITLGDRVDRNRYLPIADDYEGNYFFVGVKDSKVYLWLHDQVDGFEHVADSIFEFVEELEPSESSQREKLGKTGKHRPS